MFLNDFFVSVMALPLGTFLAVVLAHSQRSLAMITSSPQALANHHLAPHALLRMQQRGIRPELVEQVLRYGRAIHARGLLFRVIGRKEVAFFAARGINLRAAEGVHVLVQPDGSVLTTYRNQNLRAIRPCKRKHAMHH